MKQPLISKHIRMKILRTPLLQTLVNDSKKSTSPKKEHVDNIYRVWESFTSKEKNSYKNILNLTMNTSGMTTPFAPPKQTLSPLKRIKSSRSTFIKGRNKQLTRANRHESPHLKVSEEAKKFVISLNKNKVQAQEENFLKPKYVAQQLPSTIRLAHKTQCSCILAEINYQKYASVLLNNNKIFVSCRTAASDLPQLRANNIFAIISIGEEPNHFPSISGGYKHLNFDGSYQKLVGPAFSFLVCMSSNGNVLVCDETGKGPASVIIFAFLVKYSKVGFNEMKDIMKESTQFTSSKDEERFLSIFDQRKIST